jgi:hypothetical protein
MQTAGTRPDGQAYRAGLAHAPYDPRHFPEQTQKCGRCHVQAKEGFRKNSTEAASVHTVSGLRSVFLRPKPTAVGAAISAIAAAVGFGMVVFATARLGPDCRLPQRSITIGSLVVAAGCPPHRTRTVLAASAILMGARRRSIGRLSQRLPDNSWVFSPSAALAISHRDARRPRSSLKRHDAIASCDVGNGYSPRIRALSNCEASTGFWMEST